MVAGTDAWAMEMAVSENSIRLNRGADYVVLAGHLGENGITRKWSSVSVIANTTGIDACIDGHSHETVPSENIKNKNGQNVVLTQTGTKLNHIGKLTISADGSIRGQSAPSSATWTLYILTFSPRFCMASSIFIQSRRNHATAAPIHVALQISAVINGNDLSLYRL